MPSPDSARPPLPTAAQAAKALGLKPSPAELEDGHKTGASLVESVTEAGDEIVVVTARGGKHRLPRA